MISQAVETSLRRLGVQRIDLYFSHWPDADIPYDETFRAYKHLLESGKRRSIGASNHDADQLGAALKVARDENLPRPCRPAHSARFDLFKVVRGVAGLLLMLAVAGCNSEAQEEREQPPLPDVRVVTVQLESVPLTTELAGRTAAYETSEVRPQVSGVVQARLFTEGATVRQGETLYQIDPSLFEAAVAQARANVASARATEEGARLRVERLRPLAQKSVVSEQELTDGVAIANAAAAAVEQSLAALNTAEINLRFTKVAAPITGRIGRSVFTTGALVSAAQVDPLATIQRLDPIFVDIQQSSTALLRLRSALTSGEVTPTATDVHLKLEDGSEYPLTGTLEFTEVSVSPDTGTVTMRALFPNPEGLLLPGMYVRATLAQSRNQEAILVPQQAVARDPKGGAVAFVIGPGDKAEQRVLQVGRAVGNRWLVTGGLEVGDRVIVEGVSKVKPGQVVRPVLAGSPEGSVASVAAL